MQGWEMLYFKASLNGSIFVALNATTQEMTPTIFFNECIPLSFHLQQKGEKKDTATRAPCY